MSVQRGLCRIKEILVKIAERPDCAEITGYDKTAIKIFSNALDRAVQRYEAEAARVRKYHRFEG